MTKPNETLPPQGADMPNGSILATLLRNHTMVRLTLDNEALYKKIQTCYSMTLFFAFLTNDEVKSANDMPRLMDNCDDNDSIRRHCGLGKGRLARFKARVLRAHENPLE